MFALWRFSSQESRRKGRKSSGMGRSERRSNGDAHSPEEQRLKEDSERANKLRGEKLEGQQKPLPKYWHKKASVR